jgi:hypothetical protein
MVRRFLRTANGIAPLLGAIPFFMRLEGVDVNPEQRSRERGTYGHPLIGEACIYGQTPSLRLWLRQVKHGMLPASWRKQVSSARSSASRYSAIHRCEGMSTILDRPCMAASRGWLASFIPGSPACDTWSSGSSDELISGRKNRRSAAGRYTYK